MCVCAHSFWRNTTTVTLTSTRLPVLSAKAVPSEKLIWDAAEQIQAGNPYKKVLMERGLNLDKDGKYLRSIGEDYTAVQRALRTLQRREKKRLEKLNSANMKSMRESLEAMELVLQTQRTEQRKAEEAVKKLTERVATAEFETKDARQAVKQAEKKKGQHV